MNLIEFLGVLRNVFLSKWLKWKKQSEEIHIWLSDGLSFSWKMIAAVIVLGK